MGEWQELINKTMAPQLPAAVVLPMYAVYLKLDPKRLIYHGRSSTQLTYGSSMTV